MYIKNILKIFLSQKGLMFMFTICACSPHMFGMSPRITDYIILNKAHDSEEDTKTLGHFLSIPKLM